MSELAGSAAALIEKASDEFQRVLAKRGTSGEMSWEEMSVALKIADSASMLIVAESLDEIAKRAGSIPKALSAIEQQMKAGRRR